jgi:hypothetical protein
MNVLFSEAKAMRLEVLAQKLGDLSGPFPPWGWGRKAGPWTARDFPAAAFAGQKHHEIEFRPIDFIHLSPQFSFPKVQQYLRRPQEVVARGCMLPP